MRRDWWNAKTALKAVLLREKDFPHAKIVLSESMAFPLPKALVFYVTLDALETRPVQPIALTVKKVRTKMKRGNKIAKLAKLEHLSLLQSKNNVSRAQLENFRIKQGKLTALTVFQAPRTISWVGLSVKIVLLGFLATP